MEGLRIVMQIYVLNIQIVTSKLLLVIISRNLD